MCWKESYRLCRLPGLSPDSKSFLFKLIHTLIPSNERLNHLNQQVSPLCWCRAGATETYEHLFFHCDQNSESGQALLRCIQSYDRSVSEEKALRLELSADESFILPSVSLLATGLALIWENRKSKKRTALHLMRAELELSVSIKRRSRLKKIREQHDRKFPKLMFVI